LFAVDGLTVIVSETAAPLYPSLVTSVEMVIADGVKTCGEIYVAVKSPLEFVAHDTGLSVPLDTDIVTIASGTGIPELST
jgi:hypothetical protein